MALETLKGAKEIGGYDVFNHNDYLKENPTHGTEHGQIKPEIFESEIRNKKFIHVRDDKNSISFTIQNGPIKENGVNGCQVDTLIHAAKTILKGLDKKFPSKYNKEAISHLDWAIHHLDQRTKDREKRGVEGFSKEWNRTEKADSTTITKRKEFTKNG